MIFLAYNIDKIVDLMPVKYDKNSKIIKKKINMSDELKTKINWSCKFNNRPYQIIKGHLRLLSIRI